MSECFSPTIFQLTANTPRVQVEDDGPITMQKRKGPLAMLMEEMEREESEQEPMEQEPLTKSGPDGTVTDLSADVVHCGDWLAVIYDKNWWLAKAVTGRSSSRCESGVFPSPWTQHTILSKRRWK